MRLLNFQDKFKMVQQCPCGRTHNPPGAVWEATLDEVRQWALERGYVLTRCGPDVPCGDEPISMVPDWP